MNEKLCSQCGEIKPARQFFKNARDPSGLRPECKACTKDASSDRVSAYQRALAELRRLHAAEFNSLYEAEKAR